MNKSDLINLLEESCGGRCNADYNPCAYKEAARELRDMKPVAYIGVVAGGRFDTYLKAKKADLYGCDWVKPLFMIGDTDE